MLKERLAQSLRNKIYESILDLTALQGCREYSNGKETFNYRCDSCDKKEICHYLYVINDRLYDEFLKDRVN